MNLSEDHKKYWEDKVQYLTRDSLDNCIKTVGFELKWSPEILKKLYVDDIDIDGLLFWYNEILRQNKKKE